MTTPQAPADQTTNATSGARTANVPSRWRGFTLIEMIVVVVIVAALVALAAVGYGSVVANAQDSAAKTRVHQVAKSAASAAASGNDGSVVYTAQSFADAVNGLPALAVTATDEGTPQAGAGMTSVEGSSTDVTTLAYTIDTADPTHAAVALKTATGRCAGADIVGTRVDVSLVEAQGERAPPPPSWAPAREDPLHRRPALPAKE